MSRQQSITEAIEHLRGADPIMQSIIDAVGPYTLRLQRDRFRMLVGSIISQQISTSAARSIRERLDQLVGPEGLNPVNLSRHTVADLRTAGVSPHKAAYLVDLCDKINRGDLELRWLGRYSNDDIIARLTRVKGIGVWTAQMFLIFSLGRFDVFPYDDLGIRNAIRKHYRLDVLPDKPTSCSIAEAWQPFASVASWYCWRSLEKPAEARGETTATRS